MKLFLTYLLLIAPTVKTATGIIGGSVLYLWLMSWAVADCGYRPIPGRFAILGAVLLALSLLCPGEEAVAVLLETLK